MSETFNQPTLHLDDFDGPLDLLLHLIKASEMDVYDIQISTITEQYVGYLNSMQDHQLDVAGEYFVMAATLMAIKAKMLLPKTPVLADQEDEYEGDPREELVTQLLEYKRFQEAAHTLQERERDRQQQFTRPEMAVPKGLNLHSVRPGLTLARLQTAFLDMATRVKAEQPMTRTINGEQFTVAGQMTTILTRLKERPQTPVAFKHLFSNHPQMEEVVTTFIALLELTRQHQLMLQQKTDGAPLELMYVESET
ncbi:segregation and condensation protein A [Levilactobacillus bambusae]|uniref:Segregation and condensation protein A n=1 Tax=Levilactobacillus bambusae TaxID=2024736 RepID=A0A2V1N0Q1_9LACO|nr:segregation/condensation protein A [Levilactobacillus bambusae]PWG00794.1 segregation/condensation protein A [Levilactobacillus bambusae]